MSETPFPPGRGNPAGHDGPAPAAAEVARDMIAALRRGDQPGAEQAMDSYVAHASPRPDRAESPGAAAVALRDLAMEIARAAADSSG
jgi:DNA-binding GntR family transcriptional regulator